MMIPLFQKYKVIFKNIFSLTILQALTYILPLITVPYLVRVLGPNNYGIIIFASSFISYFQIVTDYGFNMSATRNISINKNNKTRINEIFSSVMIIKSMLTLIGFLVLLSIIFIFPNFKQDILAYVLAYGLVLGNLLFPVWFFQGMEEMKYITIINIIGKSISTICIFIFVRNIDDYLIVIALNSLTGILIGIISLYIIFSKFGVKFIRSKFENIVHEMKEGWYIFTTSFLSSTLTTTGTFILGLFSTKEVVGYYGAVDKIVRALVSMFSPITQAIFPHISSTFRKSSKDGKREVIKFAKVVLSVAALMCMVIFVFNKNIIDILYGEKYVAYSYILKFMAPWMFLSILNNFIGIQYLIGSGNGKFYSRSFTLCAIITLSIYLSLIKVLSFNAIILGANLGELSLTLIMIYYIKNYIEKSVDTKKISY